MLHSIPRGGWCGPAALAILTGVDKITAAETLTRTRGCTYAELEGTDYEDMALALHELGYKATPLDINAMCPGTRCGPTAARFLASRGHHALTPMLIAIGDGTKGHWITAHMGYYADNGSGSARPISALPKPKRLTTEAYRIERMT